MYHLLRTEPCTLRYAPDSNQGQESLTPWVNFLSYFFKSHYFVLPNQGTESSGHKEDQIVFSGQLIVSIIEALNVDLFDFEYFMAMKTSVITSEWLFCPEREGLHSVGQSGTHAKKTGSA